MTPYQQLIETLFDYIHDNSVKIISGLVLMGLGWYFGRVRAAAHWRKQEFLDRLNLSLNIIEPYVDYSDSDTTKFKLKIRTLSEKRCEEVFLNSAAAANIQKYAKLTTETNPILPIPKEEYWFYLNSVLNDLSEQFAVGLLKQDMNGPVNSRTYLIALTCEAAGELKTRKIRAMVIQKQHLLDLPFKMPELESPNHTTRWDTLKKLALEYKAHPECFLEVELSV